jgi:uncharacterized membrane protein YgdD (TMEM256/DUF423 family)
MKIFLSFGSLLATLGVILGAFGAHVLKTRLSPENLQVFETGVRYQMYHSLALILLFIIGQKINSSYINYSGWFFVVGIFLFSGSIFLLATRELLGIESWKSFLGPITPFGGMCFILGWIFLFLAAFKSPGN